MNQDQETQPMPERRRSPIIPGLLVLILGFALGTIFDAHFRPNHITFEVESGDPSDNPRANIAPRIHDVIVWRNRETGKPVLVNFPGESPCTTSAPDSTCVIAKPGLFEYNCVNVNNAGAPSEIICKDPGVDPQSDVGAVEITLFGKILETIKVAFGFNLRPGTGSVVQQESTRGPLAVVMTPSKYSTADSVYPVISCDASGALVITPDSVTQAGSPLTVWPGQQIRWQTSSISSPITIDFTPTQICTKGLKIGPVPPQAPVCTVINTTPSSPPDVPYTVSASTSTSTCKTGTGSLHIVPK